MFGSKPGLEQSLGRMNQLVISKFDGPKMVFWIMHTRAEMAMSVLIDALKKDIPQQEDEYLQIKMLTVPFASETLSAKEFDAVADRQVLVWGSKTEKKTLKDLTSALSSRVLGYEVKDA